ncbi:MAG: SPFH domain-containing protein [bacterium]
MGFIKAFSGALGSTLGDQWLDYYAPSSSISATTCIHKAVQVQTNNGRGSNTSGSSNVISNGSKIVVPEGMALITMQDGALTGLITDAGGYEFKSDDINAQSIFAGDGIVSPLIKQSWERFKFGGMPSSQQMAFYVNLKEIPNNKFGTQTEIYYDDAFLNTQVGLMTRGTYTLKIVDPVLFIKNFVPVSYLTANSEDFDLSDVNNDAGTQLFNEVVGTLSGAFAGYTNNPENGNRIGKIQQDQVGFAKSMAAAVEEAYQWKSDRGIEIVKTAILAIEFNETTKLLMADVNRADALSGARGNSNLQQAFAKGLQASGENGGGASMAFMGMGMNAAGPMMGAMQQPATNDVQNPYINVGNQQQASSQQVQQQIPSEDPTEKLLKMKSLLDAGAISQEDYDKVKSQVLGF